MKAPTLSVIIPVYNAERTLRTAIDSVIMQRCPDVEIVVVDDGSTDGSWEIIESYGDQVVALRQENAGASSARNHGARVSRGKFLKFLDADDFLFPEALRKQIEHAESLHDYEISCGTALLWEEGRGVKYLTAISRGIKMRKKRNTTSLDLFSWLTEPLYPTKLFKEVGGFDENVVQHDDFDLFARCILAGYVAIYIPLLTFVYRNHCRSERLSHRKNYDDFSQMLLMYERLATDLESATPKHSKDDVARSLARRIWGVGRDSIRYKHYDLAKKFFHLSRHTHQHCRSGLLPYRALTIILGPINTELIWLYFRSQVLRHIS